MAIKVQLNGAGVRALLKSPAMQADLKRRAERIAAAAGPGHKVETFEGRNRARSSVSTDTLDAMIAEQAHQTLTRAIEAGRG